MAFNRSRRKKISDSGSVDSNQILQLSLFMMLLAFFIVLNATSNFEEGKVKPVVESLYRAFSSKVAQKDVAPSDEEDIEKYFKSGQALDYLEALFDAELPQVVSGMQNKKGILSMTVDRDLFEAMITSSSETVFDKVIASLLYFGEAQKPYIMELVIPYAMKAERTNYLPIQRLEIYAQDLASRGIPKDMLMISLSEERIKGVKVIFRPYKSFSPPVNLGER